MNFVDELHKREQYKINRTMIIISISKITDRIRRGEIDNWRLLKNTKDYTLFEYYPNKWNKNIQVKVTESGFTITGTPIFTQGMQGKIRGREDVINDYYKDIIVDLLSIGLPAELRNMKS